jgi:hypothetical protein
MEWPSHQENSQSFGAATKKRTLVKAGASDSLNTDLGYSGSSKRLCTAGDLASQLPQAGGFTASPADHQSWGTDLSGQPPTSSWLAEGSISLDAWDDASVPSQIWGAGSYTMLEALPLETCETLGLHDSANVQPAWEGSGYSSFLTGTVSQSQFNDMEIEPKTDFRVMGAIDSRGSSAPQADQSPWAVSTREMVEAATASTTPVAAPDGTECEGKNSDDDLICDTCFGMVRTDSFANTPLQELLR